MQRYVIADEFGRRVNTIMWDGESVLSIGAGFNLILEVEFIPLLNEGSPYHDWDGVDSYVLNPAKVEEAKVAVWEQIKAYRAERTAGAPLIRATAVHRVTPEDLWKLPLKVVYSSSK